MDMSSSVTQQTTRSRTKPRFNPRILIFLGVLALPLGWMVYTFVSLSISGGIEQRGDYKEVNLKAMGNFPFNDRIDTEQQVPEIYRKLDGKKVLLVGQMYSDFSAAQTDRFQLVYSIANCCFGGPPKVQERVFCHMPAGKPTPIYGGLSSVYGTLRIRAMKENGIVVSLFDMDVERIKPEY